MAVYTDDDGNKYTYPASAIWKIGIPVVLVAAGVVAYVFLF
jgi:hypothetical protein